MSSNRSIRKRPKVPLDLRKRTPQACIQCRSAKRRCSSYRGEACAGCLRRGQNCEFGQVEAGSAPKATPLGICSTESPSFSQIVSDTVRHTEQNSDSVSRIEALSVLDIASDAVSKVDATADPRDRKSTNLEPHRQNLPSSDLCGTSDLEDFILKQVVSRFPSIEVAGPLFETFYQHCETNYFYFDRRWFKGLVKDFYATSVASERQVSCDTVCLMLVVLAGASKFTHLNQIQERSSSAATTDEIPGQFFYRLAQIVMPRAIAMGSLASIQACLIAGIYLLPSDERDTAYVYLGIALRMAVASRMHRNIHTQSYSPRLLEVRNRVFWTIYLNEREVSIFLGQPTSISIVDIDIPFPQFHASLDDQNEPKKLERNVALLHLIKVCDRIAVLTTREARVLHFRELQASLVTWSQEYAPEIPSTGTAGLRPSVHLALFFNLAFIYLGQHEIVDLVRRSLRNPTDQVDTTSEAAKISQEMSTMCINAAVQIIDLIESLRLRDQLALFSIVDMHSCCSAVTILMLASVLHPAHETGHKIEIAKRCLRHIATGSWSAKNGLGLIEKFQNLIDRVTARPRPGDILKVDTNCASEHEAAVPSTFENVFQNAPDSLPSKGLCGEESNVNIDSIHTYGLRESASEWSISDAERAGHTPFDYDFPGSDFLLSIEQYNFEDLAIYGFSGITSGVDYEI